MVTYTEIPYGLVASLGIRESWIYQILHSWGARAEAEKSVDKLLQKPRKEMMVLRTRR